MNFSQAIILGIVQGVTEFLPISSSAHLIIARQFLGIPEEAGFLLFDAILHLATAFVIFFYFFSDIKKIILPVFQKDHPKKKKSIRTLKYIALASIPAIVLGLMLEDWIVNNVRGVSTIIVALVVGALLLILAERISQRQKKKPLTLMGSFGIGIFQSLALIPGMSRSGSTLSGGIFFGLSKVEATKFAFLLGLPILFGVGTLKLIQAVSQGGVDPVLLIAGSLSAVFSGYLAVRFLMYIVRERTLTWFAGYRIILAIILLFFTV